MTRHADELYETALKSLPPIIGTKCPICHDNFNEHNYHDFVRCLEIINNIAKVLRYGRDGY